MIKKLLAALLIINLNGYASNLEKTEALHQEVAANQNPNITQETHPILYGMVEELTQKAQVPMPKYITIFGAQYTVIDRYGVARCAVQNFEASINLLGDLYICHEILANLSYDEIKGIIATAIVEKASNTPVLLAATGIGTFIVTVTSLYLLNKYYKLRLGSFFMSHHHRCYHEREDLAEALAFILITPSLITTKIMSNNLQKKIDIKAAKLTTAQQVIDGVKGIDKTEEKYTKENIFSRIASMLQLKEISNFVFYPIRSYTSKERIDYLEQENRYQHIAANA